jgi:hypothetical protein
MFFLVNVLSKQYRGNASCFFGLFFYLISGGDDANSGEEDKPGSHVAIVHSESEIEMYPRDLRRDDGSTGAAL